MKLMKTEPMDHQRKGSKLALANESFALWMEQGTGKTWTALKVIAVRWRRHSVRLVLVVGPKNVLGGWKRQIQEHLNVPADVFVGKKGMMQVCTELRSFDRLTFLIINYEQMWRNVKLLNGMSWDFMVTDEAHRMKNRTSRQSKQAARVSGRVKYRLSLTGTPIGKDERDLYGQFRYLDPDLFGTWKSFEKRYVRKVKIYKNDGGHWFKLRMKPGAREKITKKVAPFVYRITADEALDLPGVTHQAIYFPLTGKSLKAYESLEDDFVADFGDFKVTTPQTITQMLRLQQLTGGYLGLDDKETLLKLEQDKLAHFEDWLEDWPQGEKLVVFCKFTHEVDAVASLMKKAGRTYVIRDGRTKTKDLNAWMDFQDKPHPKVYIAQIASGGVGTDLFAARCAVFYSKSFSYIDYSQALKRLDRKGQRRKVLFLHLIAENTIDEDLYKALDDAHLTSSAILRLIQGRRNKTMAKKEKTEAAPAAETTKKAPPPRVSPDFGVPKIAAAMGKAPAEVRVMLRGGDYASKYKTEAGWDFKDQKTVDRIVKELQEVAKAREAKKAEKEAAAAEEPDEDSDEDGEGEDEPEEEPAPKPAPKAGKKKK